MRLTFAITLTLALTAGPALAQGNILIFDDVSSLGGAGGLNPPGSASTAASALGFTPTVQTSSFGAFTSQLTTGGPWAMVIVNHLNFGGMPASSDLDALNTYLTGGGRLIFQSWNLVNQGLCSHPLLTNMQTQVVCSGLGATNLFVWDAAHGMMASSPSPTTYADVVGFGVDAIAANAIAGQSTAIMGFNTPAVSPNNGAVIVRNDLKSVYLAHFPQMMGPVPAQGVAFMTDLIDCMFNPTTCNDSTTCAITSPTPTAGVGGVVDIVFDAADTQMDPITAAFDFTTDGGVTFSPMTAAATSPMPNPASGILTPSSLNTFQWSSFSDGVGIIFTQLVTMRITVTDGMPTPGPSTCDVFVVVLNPTPPPTCMISIAGGGPLPLGGDLGLTVDAQAPGGSLTVDIALEFSTDGGTTFNPCTMTGASPNPNPRVAAPVGISLFDWDSRADNVGVSAPTPTTLRATVNDGTLPGTCTVNQLIDNTQLCVLCGDCNLNSSGPDIIDSLTAAQIAVGLVVPTAIQAACCDVNVSSTVDVVDALFIAQSAAGLPAILTCI